MYDINRALLRSQPTPSPPRRGTTESGVNPPLATPPPRRGRKKKKARVEGESFLVA
ncbi:MAG: hypothetical protein F6K48_05450 [Okeania sp. SIO3H1]|uniref:hypothetical protein n=1 Tax=Okeania sp. SIO1I7 TaxID=2607772 RepID=UPI0013CCC999|nr:hypothetical protein [Okeania sp. SIO1I7]NEN88394.1 hypothetical protein [Okeania sp. SIO3H1]NET24132.1 hypothetical protein [Okeania sp. SIO1I7]